MADVKVLFEPQANVSGDPERAAQGFGRVRRETAPAFDPIRDADAAVAFFERARLRGAGELPGRRRARHAERLLRAHARPSSRTPGGSGERRKPHHRNQGLIYSQPLLDYPELDPFTRQPRSFPVVARLLGGEDAVRFAEFNFRETPEGAGQRAMNFHHDAVRDDRLTREPYNPCDWLCAIHYLTDVEPGAPCFCVVPDSRRFESLQAAFEGLGESYSRAAALRAGRDLRALRHRHLPHPARRRRPPDAAHLAPVLRARRLAAQPDTAATSARRARCSPTGTCSPSGWR